MKLIKSLLVLVVVAVPGLASAQGYYGGGGPPPVPGGFHNRMGRITYGISAGLGVMGDDGGQITCPSCSYNPISGELDFHLGGMLSPRLGLMFEAQVNAQTLHKDVLGDTTLVQGAAMAAVQYWLTPIIWVKGGLGLAHLSVDDSFYGTTTPVSDGLAVMGGVGVELLSARFLAIDLQGRLLHGTYGDIGDHVTALSVGLGVNWY
jgi:hypothetical protein